jgi:hypothetical protein
MVIPGAGERFSKGLHPLSVGVQSQMKDKSTRKKMASVESSPCPVSLNAQRSQDTARHVTR